MAAVDQRERSQAHLEAVVDRDCRDDEARPNEERGDYAVTLRPG